MDKKQAVYFFQVLHFLIWVSIFILSSETEAGSAGEQPARDRLDDRRKSHFKGTALSGSFDIFRGLYAFKNSSANFFFRAADNPLWFLNLFFRSAKCPSIAFVVFGICKLRWSYQVKSHGKFVFKLL